MATKTLRGGSQLEGRKEDEGYVSYDAPPLDYSFKNIKNILELRDVEPRNGEKALSSLEKQESKIKKEEKEEEVVGEGQDGEHKGDKKKNQNNINSVVSTMINSSAMKNISSKAKQQLQKKKKKCIQVKLVCVSLMLSYNKIRQMTGLPVVLEGIMSNSRGLQWIDISHNYLVTLDYNFCDFQHLKTLYLHCNFISDLGEIDKLKHLQELKTMTVHGNPLTAVPNFRILTISILQELKKLDSVLISKKERDNAVFIRSQTKKYPQPKNPPMPPQEKKEEDDEDRD